MSQLAESSAPLAMMATSSGSPFVVAADEHVGHEVLGAVLYALRHLDQLPGTAISPPEGRIAAEDAHLVHKHDALALIGRRNAARSRHRPRL